MADGPDGVNNNNKINIGLKKVISPPGGNHMDFGMLFDSSLLLMLL